MIQFIKSEVLVIVLTIISLTCTEHPMWLMLVASLIVMLFCARSLQEEEGVGNKLFRSGMLALFVVYCVVSGTAFACLIFCEFNIRKLKWGNVFVPLVAYVCVMPWIIKEPMARHVLNGVILLAVATVYYSMQETVRKYIINRGQVDDIVKVAAVGELYEMKLNRELVVKNYLADRNARLEERENISRNIHNSVGHSITAAIMTLGAADMLYDTNPELARQKMRIANERIKGGLESIRHAVRVLDKDTESISCDDFEKTLLVVAEDFAMDTSIKIRTAFTRIAQDVRIPHEHAEFMTGALQELLTNGVKHANADVFDVQVLSNSGHVRMSVTDNGKSTFDNGNKDVKIKNGFGLKKIASYVERCGGKTVMEAQDGFKCEITLPIIKEENYG